MFRSAEYWLTRVLIGEKPTTVAEPETQKPRVDSEVLLDTINSFEGFAKSPEGIEMGLRTVRVSESKMVAWFDPDGYQYKAIMVSLKAPNTRFVLYTGRNKHEISTWMTQYCSSDVKPGDLAEQMKIAISKAKPVLSESYRQREPIYSDPV